MASSETAQEAKVMHPLDGARLKVVRAQEHIDSLKAELRMYLDDRPYEIVAKQDGYTWHIDPAITIQPPLRFSTIIGDCVTNLRAALDYITWQLATRHFANPTIEDNDRRWVSFPIYLDPLDSGYVNKINRFTNRSLPAGAITAMKDVQPHCAGYQQLWWLHELVNADKHRLPLLTVSEFGDMEMAVVRRLGGTYTLLAQASSPTSFSLPTPHSQQADQPLPMAWR